MSGRTIAISDIHGCDTALTLLLKELSIQETDTVVILGDVIDRGPGSRQCIEQLLALRKQCRLVLLMGNHEEMLFDAMQNGRWADSWLLYGGREFLDSYGGDFNRIPVEHLDFLRNGKDYFATDSTIFVHGFLRWNVPVEQESARYLRWERYRPGLPPHVSGKRVICGHTAQSEGRPVGNENWLCLDTCAYCPHGRLSALEVDTETLWQSSQQGDTLGPIPLRNVLKNE